MTQKTVIAEDQLKTTGECYQVRKLTMTDLTDIERLQTAVKQSLSHSDQLQPLSAEEFQHILAGNGFMIGIFIKNTLVAFRAMMVPDLNNPEHLGLETGLSKEEFPKMIHSEISVVHPDYRGNGLQHYMGNVVLSNVDTSQFRYVAATVAPFNIASLKDKLSLSMTIVALIETYGGKMRYVLFRDLLARNNPSPQNETTVEMDDIDTQQELLLSGYQGVAIHPTHDTFTVTYQSI